MIRPLLWMIALCVSCRAAFADAAASAPADGPLRVVLQQVFDAFPTRDTNAALRAVTDVEHQRAVIRAFLVERFAGARDLHYRFRQFRTRERDDLSALARARVQWSGKDATTGKPDEGELTWDLRFILELGEWKLWAFRPAEPALYERYLAAADHPARTALLHEDPELTGSWLPYLLRVDADRSTDEGKFTEAERLSDLALEAADDLGSEKDRAYAYLVRGYLREKRRERNPALHEYDEALHCFERLKDSEGIGKAWRNAGRVYSAAGLFQQAIDAWENAVRRFHEAGVEAAEAGSLQDVGTAYQSSGRAPDAVRTYEQALGIYRRLGNRKGEAEVLGNIASVRINQGRYAEALAGIDAARRIHRELGDRDSESLLLTNTGNIYFALGKSAEARDAYEGAVRVSRELGRKHDLMVALYNLAAYHSQMNDPDAAMVPALESAQLAGELKDESISVNTQLLLGSVLLEIGKTDAAREAFEQAVTDARRAGQEAEEGTALLSLGFVAQTEHRYPEALRYAAQARTIAVRVGNTFDQFRTWVNEGVIYREQRDWKAAAKAFEQATSLVELTRDQARVRSLQTSYFRQYANLYGELAQCYLSLGQPERAFAAAEELKSRALVDVIEGGNVRIDGKMTAEERRSEAVLEERLAGLASSAQKAALTDERVRLLRERDQVRAELETFREGNYLRHPDLRTRRAAFSPASPRELGEGLLAHSPRTAILCYVVRGNETLLFVVHRGRSGRTELTCHRIPIDDHRLLEWADQLWKACSHADGKYELPSRVLFRTLIGPAAPELAGKDRIVVVPDPQLASLPFAALLDGRRIPLVSRYAISYAPSAPALLKLTGARRAATSGAPTLLALGAPEFPRGFPDLPESRAEVLQVGRLFGHGATVLTGRNASETEAKRRMGGARYIHFATHGVLDPRVPMDSAIVLTAGGGSDGFLRARELVDLDLHADLVVLSACETALGQKVRGEGVIGLTWALFAGGARSCIATHWQVADESTRELMVAFYRRLRSTAGHGDEADALRHAQLKLLESRHFAHPYYWAPFTLSGWWTPAENLN